MIPLSFYRAVSLTLMIIMTAAAGYLGYRVVRGDVAAAVYRERLGVLAQDYETLRTRYNDAVKRTAVTELVVKDGLLRVELRDQSGALASFLTPLDPNREIYVDYAVVDGRLLVRRVFDANTPPSQGFVLDPRIAHVDWEAPNVAHGKAVYRTLSDGRWTISVAGNGALGIVRSTSDQPAELESAPEIRTYEQELAAAAEEVKNIGFGDLWRMLTRGTSK